ncbi:PQQ-dependent sugar dehydrogenase [Ornithinibacter aureus]|uniref:PQQ-dependent sugar dehydrogenase n=1 Tax=Ornithinibacter aureus TaxID=622664 RepID=A0ABP8JND3_9MICO|nr:PQQ-dependent sugar dehydrogenase [Ornithinibacter aureus]KAF0834784.1 glucose/arabinose dehydrogenase [Ornithinibacter aureus]
MSPRSIAPLAAAVLLASVTLAGCSGDDGVGEVPVTPTRTASDGVSPSGGATASPAPRSAEVPALDVEVVAKGFEHGWDIGFLPDGRALVTERPGRISIVSGLREGATRTTVEADLDDLFVSGEGGLMGMVVHPDFATSRLFTTCQTHQENGQPKDVRLVTWKLSADGTSAQKWRDLLTGLPISTGRHSGCRPTIAPGAVNDSGEDELFVGTGDVAQADVPQSRTSLGGKVLRLDLETGFPLSGNPFFSLEGERERYVYSYGHRNIQGVAVQPGTGAIYTAEHGPSNNDEVNLITAGGNYGWDPSRKGMVDEYDESVPMTDLELYPDAVPAVWQSGERTQAICGAAFLEGDQWGALDGALVITALKGSKLLVLTLADDGSVEQVAVPQETDGPFGRMRAARLGPDGALYVTTTNGDDDQLLRITPRA